MKKDRIRLSVFTAFMCAWLLAGLPSMADEPESAATSGRKGTATLIGETRVGHLTLQPGLYWIQHRSEGFQTFRPLHMDHVAQRVFRRCSYCEGIPRRSGMPDETSPGGSLAHNGLYTKGRRLVSSHPN